MDMFFVWCLVVVCFDNVVSIVCGKYLIFNDCFFDLDLFNLMVNL